MRLLFESADTKPTVPLWDVVECQPSGTVWRQCEVILYSNFHDLPVQDGSRKQLKLSYHISFSWPCLDFSSTNGLLDLYPLLSANRADAPHLLLYCCCLLSIKLRFPSTSLIMKGNDRNDALFDRENQIKYDCLISNWKCWFLVWKRCVRVRLMILFYWGYNLCWIAETWWHFGPLHMNTVLKIVVCWQNRWMNGYQKLPAEHTRWGNAGKKIKKDYPCKWWKVKRVYQSVTAGCRLKAWVTVCQLFFCCWWFPSGMKWGYLKADVDSSMCFLMIRMHLPLGFRDTVQFVNVFSLFTSKEAALHFPYKYYWINS